MTLATLLKRIRIISINQRIIELQDAHYSNQISRTYYFNRILELRHTLHDLKQSNINQKK